MYLEEVIDRAYPPNNKSGILISIKVLEMVFVIVNTAAAIFVCDHDSIDLSTFPIYFSTIVIILQIAVGSMKISSTV